MGCRVADRSARGGGKRREEGGALRKWEGPEWGFPRGDARLDLTDLYAFPKPGDAGKSILMVTEDKVGPHGDLLAEFPYLGPPHNA